jgi:hypothetical protein
MEKRLRFSGAFLRGALAPWLDLRAVARVVDPEKIAEANELEYDGRHLFPMSAKFCCIKITVSDQTILQS